MAGELEMVTLSAREESKHVYLETDLSDTACRPSVLDSILGEMPKEVFLTEYLDRRFLTLLGPSSRFEKLLAWDDLNQLLETHMFVPATLRVKKAGLDVPPDSYLTEYSMTRDVSATRVSSKALTKELREGATLIVNEIQKLWPPIGTLAEDLEAALNARININMYVGFHENHGFGCHYDTHDVLVLQVHGRKRWQVFDRKSLTPLPNEPFDKTKRPELAAPLWEGILTQGDALYLPRGQWHFAKPIGEPTLHLSIGIVHPTGLDVLKWLNSQLIKGELVRRIVPQFAPEAARESYVASIREALISEITAPNALEAFLRDRAVADGGLSNPRFGLPWCAMEAGLPPSDESTIHVATPARRLLHDAPDADGKVRLYVDGKPGPEFRAAVTPLCDHLTRNAPLSVRDFVADFSTQFDTSVLRAFLTELVTAGLIVVRPAMSDHAVTAHR